MPDRPLLGYKENECRGEEKKCKIEAEANAPI